MRTIAVFLAVLSLLVIAPAAYTTAQEITETPKLAGTWDITMIGKTAGTVKEQWVLQQDGNKFTGTAKGAQGEKTLTGDLTGGTGISGFVKHGSMQQSFRAVVIGDEFDGAISENTGKDGKFMALRAKRAKT